MRQYIEYCKNILAVGRWSKNRTSKRSIKTWGGNMRFDLSKGAPIVTTRKTYVRSAIVELIWFLQGDTNIKFLKDNNCKFWDEWALTEEDVNKEVPLTDIRALEYLFNKLCERDSILRRQTWKEFQDEFYDVEEMTKELLRTLSIRNRVDSVPIALATYKDIGFRIGDLGPVYGKMWRAWPTADGRFIDQIKEVESLLRNNPTSRRIIVSAWNPELLPDETLSPQENVLNGKQALAPCHTLFQFGTEDLIYMERVTLLRQSTEKAKEYSLWATSEAGLGAKSEDVDRKLDELGVPKYRLNCKLLARSQDSCLGTPVNIFSYSLITYMLCHVHNMVPGFYEHSVGDAHFYEDQIKGVKLQLTREPIEELAKVVFKRKPSSIVDFTIDDIEVVDYKSHPEIKHERPAI